MRVDGIVVPRVWRPTPTRRLQERVWRQRERNAGEPREIRLPVAVGPDHRLVGCPPSGMFTFVERGADGGPLPDAEHPDAVARTADSGHRHRGTMP
jgi:hypothetical protein